jgi:hypothetical protein
VRDRGIPDVIGIRKDGRIDVWEVESVSDNAYALYHRVARVMNGVPDSMKGTIKVLRPKGIIKDVKAADSNGKHLRKTSADADQAFKRNEQGFEEVDWRN